MTDKPQNDISNSEEWQEAKSELDQMDLLMRQTFALEAIEQHLRAMRATESNDTAEQEGTHTCQGCNKEIPESELESHARSCMNWGQTLGDVKEMYR